MSKTFEADVRNLRKLEKTLGRISAKAVPHAARNGLNAIAFEARGAYVETAQKGMINRNTFTARSIRFTKATGTKLATMESRVGSVAKYMRRQEDGDTVGKKGKHGVPIPTSVAAGQAAGTKPRTRLVRKANKLPAINLASRTGGNRQRRNAVQIIMAMKGNGVAFLDLGKRKGLFRVHGTKRGLKVRMVWDLSKPSVKVEPNPMLKRATDAVAPKIPALCTRALKEQIERALKNGRG